MSRSSTRLAVQITLIIVGYYLLPLTEVLDGAVVWLRVLAGLAVLAVVALWVSRQVVREMQTLAPDVHVDNLLLTIVVGVTAFAGADLVLAASTRDSSSIWRRRPTRSTSPSPRSPLSASATSTPKVSSPVSS